MFKKIIEREDRFKAKNRNRKTVKNRSKISPRIFKYFKEVVNIFASIN